MSCVQSGFGYVSFGKSGDVLWMQQGACRLVLGDTFSISDVSAATSVLLGSAPLSFISDESASKLNELLVPNPFHRPCAVLLLILEQVKPGKFGYSALGQTGSTGFVVAHHRQLQIEAKASTLILSEDALLLNLNTTIDGVLKSTLGDGELNKLALFLGGSYEATKEPLKGVLSIELPDGDMVTLDLEKEEHRDFVLKLSAFFHRVQDAAQTLDRMSGGLVVGTLTVSKEFYEAPDSSITLTEASNLHHLVVRKVFAHLDRVLNGGLVGVIVHPQQQTLDLKFNSGPARLQLLQTLSDTTTTVAEVLTETIIVYITGIILIVALIIGETREEEKDVEVALDMRVSTSDNVGTNSLGDCDMEDVLGNADAIDNDDDESSGVLHFVLKLDECELVKKKKLERVTVTLMNRALSKCHADDPLYFSVQSESNIWWLGAFEVKKEDHAILYWIFHNTNIPEVIDKQTNHGEVLRVNGRGDFQVQWHLAGDLKTLKCMYN
ncbi:hypothetical protein L7F22_001750 [Adiantum nelumboides]|nr:hypothetical protein [Adiantum nelumboides]